MKCPNRRCRQQTNKQVCWTDKKGKAHWGCSNCIWSFRPEAKNSRVRTGRKIWHSYEVYGQEKTMEKNQEWIKGVEHRAALNRREVGCISEGAFKVLEEHSSRGLIRRRENGRPVR